MCVLIEGGGRGEMERGGGRGGREWRWGEGREWRGGMGEGVERGGGEGMEEGREGGTGLMNGDCPIISTYCMYALILNHADVANLTP